MTDLMGAIPISKTVKISPSAIGAAGGVSFINGLILTQRTDVLPAGQFRSFGSSADVATAFTPTSVEAQMAAVYFAGFTGTTQTPGTLYFYGVDGTTHQDPAAIMNAVTSATQAFTGFTTAYEPPLDDKKAFATWTGAQASRYWYVPWDTDEQALVKQNSTSFGTWLKAQAPDGTTVIYKDPLVSALCLGWMASLNFDATNGRTNLAFRRNGLVSPSAVTGQMADVLIANGYSFYGANANGLGQWQWLSNGAVSGQFLWADSYINQVWLNASFQSDLVNLLLSLGQIPYNVQGDGLISAAVQNTISQAVNFGVIRPGVALTDLQKQQIDSAAGTTISDTVQTRGWYFQPNASSTPASTRVARGSPPCRFWYTDGQSVQSINMASMEVQ